MAGLSASAALLWRALHITARAQHTRCRHLDSPSPAQAWDTGRGSRCPGARRERPSDAAGGRLVAACAPCSGPWRLRSVTARLSRSGAGSRPPSPPPARPAPAPRSSTPGRTAPARGPATPSASHGTFSATVPASISSATIPAGSATRSVQTPSTTSGSSSTSRPGSSRRSPSASRVAIRPARNRPSQVSRATEDGQSRSPRTG